MTSVWRFFESLSNMDTKDNIITLLDGREFYLNIKYMYKLRILIRKLVIVQSLLALSIFQKKNLAHSSRWAYDYAYQ